LDDIISFWKRFEGSGSKDYEEIKALYLTDKETPIKCGEMVFRPQEVLSLLHFTQMPAYFVHHVSPDPNYSLETLRTCIHN
jgi:hypothetical protein